MSRFSYPALLSFGLLTNLGCAVLPGPRPPVPFGLGPALDQFIPLFLLMGLGAAIWLVVGCVREAPPANNTQQQISRAEGIVCDRYARGEMKREEFLQMLNDLRGSDQNSARTREKSR